MGLFNKFKKATDFLSADKAKGLAGVLNADKMSDLLNSGTDKLSDIVDSGTDKINEFADSGIDKLNDQIIETAESGMDKTHELVAAGAEKLVAGAEKIHDLAAAGVEKLDNFIDEKTSSLSDSLDSAVDKLNSSVDKINNLDFSAKKEEIDDQHDEKKEEKNKVVQIKSIALYQYICPPNRRGHDLNIPEFIEVPTVHSNGCCDREEAVSAIMKAVGISSGRALGIWNGGCTADWKKVSYTYVNDGKRGMTVKCNH